MWGTGKGSLSQCSSHIQTSKVLKCVTTGHKLKKKLYAKSKEFIPWVPAWQAKILYISPQEQFKGPASLTTVIHCTVYCHEIKPEI